MITTRCFQFASSSGIPLPTVLEDMCLTHSPNCPRKLMQDASFAPDLFQTLNNFSCVRAIALSRMGLFMPVSAALLLANRTPSPLHARPCHARALACLNGSQSPNPAMNADKCCPRDPRHGLALNARAQAPFSASHAEMLSSPKHPPASLPLHSLVNLNLLMPPGLLRPRKSSRRKP